MIKLYNWTPSNIGRGVIVECYGRPCKRVIKNVVTATDANGTHVLVDVTRGRNWWYTSYGELVPLDRCWDNWHAWLPHGIETYEKALQTLEDEPRKLLPQGYTQEQLEVRRVAYTNARDKLMAMKARLDAATEKRRTARKLVRELREAGRQSDQLLSELGKQPPGGDGK